MDAGEARPLPLMFIGDDRRVLLIGAGVIGREKLERLLDAGIHPDVIAARVDPEVAELARKHKLVVRERPYAPGDTEGYPLVLVAIGGARDVARAIFDEVTARGGLINCADDPILCNVFLSANLRAGGVTVAVSSHGASSAMASRLRDRLRASLPSWAEAALPRLSALRARLKQLPGDAAKRRSFLQRVVRGPLARKLGKGEVTEDALVERYASGDPLDGELIRIVLPTGADTDDALTLGGADALARADTVISAHGIPPGVMERIRPGAAIEHAVADPEARAAERVRVGDVVVLVITS